jgi:molecular chaperone GrpE
MGQDDPNQDDEHDSVDLDQEGEQASLENVDTDGLEADELDASDPLDQASGDEDSPEVAELKDKLLRSLAELENIKRRATRDVENAHKFAVEKLIDNMFPVIDSLEKAVETAQEADGAGAIAEGVELSLKLFVDTLAKSGVEQIDPLGEPFNPQHHEALTVVPNPDAEPNTVMEVMQKGYVLNGRLVRAAKVIVVKGDS